MEKKTKKRKEEEDDYDDEEEEAAYSHQSHSIDKLQRTTVSLQNKSQPTDCAPLTNESLITFHITINNTQR